MIHYRPTLLLLLLLVGISSIPSKVNAQYDFSGVDKQILWGAGTATVGLSFVFDKKVPLMTMEERDWLRANKTIKGIDAYSTRHFSKTAQRHSDILLYSSPIWPTLLLADNRVRKNFGDVGLLALETLILNLGVTNLVKTLVKRPRPYVFNSDVDWAFVSSQERDARKSFPSGHTSTAACMSFLAASVYADFRPEDEGVLLYLGAATIPALTGYLRMRAGKHYFTDVLAGFVLGSAIGILVPKFHYR